jgi:hypothetical protein
MQMILAQACQSCKVCVVIPLILKISREDIPCTEEPVVSLRTIKLLKDERLSNLVYIYIRIIGKAS